MNLFKNGRVDKEMKKKLMDKYPALTEDDFIANDEDKLMNHLQEETGKTKSELLEIMNKR